MNQNMNQKVSNIALIIIISFFIAIIAFGGGVYVWQKLLIKDFVQDNNYTSTESNSISGPTPSFLRTSLEGLSPKEVYLRLKEDWDAAQNYDDLIKIGYKYGDSDYVSRAKEGEKQIEQSGGLSPDAKKGLFNFSKALIPPTNLITDIQEKINGNSAILTVLATGHGTGTVNMTLEDGIWKLSKESWAEKNK